MRRELIALCLLPMLAGTVRASDAAALTEPLVVSVQREPVNTTIPIFRALVTAGENKFTFLLPEKFHTSGDAPHGRLQLASPEGGTLITFTFFSPTPATGEIRPEPFRELLSARYPGGKFLPEFVHPAAGRVGRGFDVEWLGAGGLPQTTRAVYLPTVAGVLELTAVSASKNAKAAQADLNEVLGSFCASVNGKLEVHHIGAVN